MDCGSLERSGCIEPLEINNVCDVDCLVFWQDLHL